MDPQQQQSLNYIREQLAAGQNEATIRAGFAQSGWPLAAVDDLFTQYHASQGQGADPLTPQPLTTVATPTAPFQPPAKPKHVLPKLFIPVIITGVVLVAITLIVVLGLHKASGPKTVNPVSQAALSQNAGDVARRDDSLLIVSGISNYLASHSGNLPDRTATGNGPDTLLLCGGNCTPASEVPVSLSHYKNTPQAVSFHVYAKDLKVPDAETVYIVDNANCRGTKLGADKQSSRAAVLFALPADSGLQQDCTGL